MEVMSEEFRSFAKVYGFDQVLISLTHSQRIGKSSTP